MQHGNVILVETLWQGRRGFKLGNGLVELIALTGGGHIAEFRFSETAGRPRVNPLWTPLWKGIDSYRYRTGKHSRQYGSIDEGKLLAGIAGHSLCLDYFGSPSVAEAALGLSQHGEAPNSLWSPARRSLQRHQVTLGLSARLPAAGLQFQREITLRKNQPVAYFKETVYNERRYDHFFHWVQHVTLGPPFISRGESRVFLPGSRGITFPFEYNEHKSLLARGREFLWPNAPTRSGRLVNLERVLIRPGLGFVASVLVDPRRDWGYIAALNLEDHLLIGYCFRREDFPWVAVWEENRAIRAVPWRGRTEARGLEFGTTPIPSTRGDVFSRGNLYNTKTLACVPARHSKTIEYLAFLSEVPSKFTRIRDVRYSEEEIVVSSDAGAVVARIPASLGFKEILKKERSRPGGQEKANSRR